jgi:hypothetical protein
MANKVEWDLKMTPINISTYEVSIAATRTETDETDPQNPVVVSSVSYNVARAKIETSQDQLNVGQEIWSKHQAALAKAAAVDAFVADAEAAGKAYLEGLK